MLRLALAASRGPLAACAQRLKATRLAPVVLQAARGIHPGRCEVTEALKWAEKRSRRHPEAYAALEDSGIVVGRIALAPDGATLETSKAITDALRTGRINCIVLPSSDVAGEPNTVAAALRSVLDAGVVDRREICIVKRIKAPSETWAGEEWTWLGDAVLSATEGANLETVDYALLDLPPSYACTDEWLWGALDALDNQQAAGVVQRFGVVAPARTLDELGGLETLLRVAPAKSAPSALAHPLSPREPWAPPAPPHPKLALFGLLSRLSDLGEGVAAMRAAGATGPQCLVAPARGPLDVPTLVRALDGPPLAPAAPLHPTEPRPAA